MLVISVSYNLYYFFLPPASLEGFLPLSFAGFFSFAMIVSTLKINNECHVWQH